MKKLLLGLVLLLFLTSCTSATFVCLIVDKGMLEAESGKKYSSYVVICKEYEKEGEGESG